MFIQTIKYLTVIGLAFLFINQKSSAQRLKFKDIFETIAAGDYNPDIVLTQLKEYKQKEPEEGNQYYQLGRIYYERTVRFDILKQNNGALQVADSAIHYLTIAKKLIDEKEVKKKDEYYREFAKNPADPKSEVTLKMVYTKIDLYINNMNKFKTNISKIYSDFNAAVDNYNMANILFTEVYSQFSTYKEMSLLAKEDFLKKMDLMKFHFDEGISYFEQYLADIKAYPIEGYKQEYTLADINNYRLHGITKANFLQNDITLWNYGKWHGDINQYLDGEVKPFRKAIIDNEKALNEKLTSMSKTTIPDEEEYRITSDILMLIRKYDPASFLVDIFEYKQARINMLNSEVLSLDPIDFDKRASRYATTLYYARSGLQSLLHAEQNIADISLKRHESFLNSYYKNGIPTFISEQRKLVTPTLEYTWGELKNELVVRKEVNGATETFGTTKDGNGQIPLFKRDTNTYLAMENEFVTGDIFQDKNFVYASGYQLVDSTRKAFVAFYRGDSLKWMMFPKVVDTLQSEVLAVTSVGQGGACLMYTYSKRDKNQGETFIVEFTNAGKEILRTNVANDKYPTELIYTPADNLFGCIFENLEDQGNNSSKKVYISKIDQEGKAQWETPITIGGSVVALTPFKDSFVLTCNVTEAQDKTGKTISPVSGQGIFSIRISPKGELGDHFLSEASQAHFASYVLNNKDLQINIFGFMGQVDNTPLPMKSLLTIWLNGDLFPVDSTIE